MMTYLLLLALEDKQFINKKPNTLIINMLGNFNVDLMIPYSNSFYQNLTEIYNLKELLYNEGIADYKRLPFMKPINDSNT